MINHMSMIMNRIRCETGPIFLLNIRSGFSILYKYKQEKQCI